MVGGSSERRRPATAAAASSATELRLHHRQRQCHYLLTSITLTVNISGDGACGHWLVRMEWHPAG